MSEARKADLCVIGAGHAGLTAALSAAAFGVRVVLVRTAPDGDFNRALARRALVASARKAEILRQAKPFGLSAPRPKIDFYQVHDHIQAALALAAPNSSTERLTALGIRVIDGKAHFKDPATLLAADGVEISARRFVIATGSVPAVPPIAGLKETPYLTGETIFDLLIAPKHLAIIGATPEGIELAQAYRRLGAEVTLLEAGQPLADEDPECAAVLLDQLAREGVALRADANIDAISSTRAKINLLLTGPGGEEKLEASHLLIAARMPNIDELQLAAAGVEYGPGGVIVDRHLRTSNKNIYAIGGVAGGGDVALAKRQAELAVRHAFLRIAPKLKASDVPRVIQTDPELAHVGLTEAQARQAGHNLRILRWPYRENDRAGAERRSSGHIKVIIKKGGKILGATVVGTHASELIGVWALAVKEGMNIHAIADLPVAYPAYGEISKQAAGSYFTPILARPSLRRVMALLRLLG